MFNVENQSDKVLNTTVTWAVMMAPNDPSRSIHNFTGQLIPDGVVKPNAEASFEYRLPVPLIGDQAALENVNIVALVEYTFAKAGSAGGKSFVDIFLNQTVTIEPKKEGYGIKDVFSVILGLSVASAGLYIIKDLLFATSSSSSSGSSKAMKVTDDDEELFRAALADNISNSGKGKSPGSKKAEKRS